MTNTNFSIKPAEKDAVYNRILSSLYGQAYADAFGMPSELWTRKQVQDFFGIIDDFIAGPEENIAAYGFNAGQFTDDTSQAIAIIDSFIESKGKVDSLCVAKHIMDWALKIGAFEKNILGPSSKAALTQISNNIPIENLENLGVTNGAPMRIAPVGMLTDTKDISFFEQQVYNACAPTHKSDVAIAGASAIAYMISKQVSGYSWSDTLPETIEYSKEIQHKYHNTFSPFVYARINEGIKLAERFIDVLNSSSKTSVENTPKHSAHETNILNAVDQEFAQQVYEIIGTDMQTYNSVPAAFAVAHYCMLQNAPLKIAHICANLGGDTDTTGAMSLAMASAGYDSNIYPKDHIKLLTEANNIDFENYAKQIFNLRVTL
ncbi:ADP-ribosylglycohydrolase family protein [Actinomyces sp. zg-332]|uniref:ADP-ribosylglycohydrolase family protein n=1 Tax=Actinomyces sp. zg-332 TaxID=2708340 RepID=UPI00141F7B8C|nr:ADP-ribosylglycohydrolase family protein [Actinomyces sp. zg-332]QPK94547.1 ADP-ribosylglycohydrolase family protein [Actinomyces sp. zg-332]